MRKQEDSSYKIYFIPINDCQVRGSVTLIMRKEQYYTAENHDFIHFLERRFLNNQEALNVDLKNRGVLT